MSIELKVPEVGESITEVEIGEWMMQAGDMFNQDDTLVMIETDKVTVELPAPSAGTITKIIKKQGDSAEVGEVIALMEEGEGRSTELDPKTAALQVVPPQTVKDAAEARVMPAAKRELAQRGLSAGDVRATGPGGRLLKQDVIDHNAASAKSVRPPATTSDRQQEVVPMSLLRRRVAERLVQAQQTAALLTTFNEIDMSKVMELRRQFKEAFIKRFDIKLGFSSFFVKAAIEALKAFPAVNAEIKGDDVVYKNYYDIGIAVGGGKGLVVPIVRSAELSSFAEIEKTIADFAARAKSGKLSLSELQGGTFTITNGGVYGSMMSTPIINPPQSGILGLHAIEERPIAISGAVVVRPMMYVALTYDHRIVDGREAVSFLVRIKECIEEPSRILLEI